MIKVVVSGALGRMGKRLQVLINLDKKLETIGGIDQTRGVFDGVEVFTEPEEIVKSGDIIIDFSSPELTVKVLDECVKASKPIVIGTTGLDDHAMKKINKFSEYIPILQSPNMSLGVNLLFSLTKIATSILKKDFEIEIMEIHHHHKKDAPSGTAMKLGEIIAKEKNKELKDILVTGREGHVGDRKKNELGIFALRGGNTVGEHSVMYFGGTERLELVHKATSRDTFVFGAIKAAKFLVKKKPGLYTMADVLGLDNIKI